MWDCAGRGVICSCRGGVWGWGSSIRAVVVGGCLGWPPMRAESLWCVTRRAWSLYDMEVEGVKWCCRESPSTVSLLFVFALVLAGAMAIIFSPGSQMHMAGTMAIIFSSSLLQRQMLDHVLSNSRVVAPDHLDTYTREIPGFSCLFPLRNLSSLGF